MRFARSVGRLPRIIKMTRLLIRLMICSALGVITTVLLAWSCALGPDPSWPDERLKGYLHWDGDGHLWRVHLLQRRGSVELYSSSFPSDRQWPGHLLEQLQAGTWIPGMPLLADEAIPHWSRFHRTLNDAELAELRTVWHEHAYGWPMPALRHVWTRMNGQEKLGRSVKGSLEWGPWRLPTQPLWIGLLANSVFFAGALYLLMRLPGIIRRYARRAIGRCPACGELICSADGRFCDGCGHCITWLGA